MPIYKTTITVTVFHEAYDQQAAETNMAHRELEEVASQIDSGDWIGQTEIGPTVRVPRSKLKSELLAIGNDGTFFEMG